MDERVRFVTAYCEDENQNFSGLCRSFGISRKTGYKWLDRFAASGGSLESLQQRVPIAKHFPHATAPELVDRLIVMRKEQPLLGPRKLRAMLLEELGEGHEVPAASTIGDLLKRHGLVHGRRRRSRVPPSASPLGPCDAPNVLWCADGKGDITLADKTTRCKPLTIMDGCIRYLLKTEVGPKLDTTFARKHFELAFRENGLPERIRTDNGAPFASKAPGGLSALSVWWIKLGICHERIEPGQPQQNGRHERMHRTLEEHVAWPPSATLEELQRRLDRFRHYYNDQRPHEALGQVPPARRYVPSARVFPERPREIEYPSDFIVRRATKNGAIRWGSRSPVMITRLVRNEPLGLRVVDDDEHEVFFGPVLLGVLQTRGGHAHFDPLL